MKTDTLIKIQRTLTLAIQTLEGENFPKLSSELVSAMMLAQNELVYPSLPWLPISNLMDKYENELLLMAPELVDLDCNAHGVGMGYFQDDGLTWHMDEVETRAFEAAHPNLKDYGSWMACKWSMTNDEWSHVCCTPTHYLKLTGI